LLGGSSSVCTIVLQREKRQQSLGSQGEGDTAAGVGDFESPQQFERHVIPRHTHHCATSTCSSHLLFVYTSRPDTTSGQHQRLRNG
jgi:hypothetical protein